MQKGRSMAKDNETSRYFTLVIYPKEIKGENLAKLFSLGWVYISPIHNQEPICYDELPSVLSIAGIKEHQHYLFKMPNKQTENSFIQKVCEVLHKDLTGVAIHKGDCLVKDVSMMIRYFYHMDSPNKEPFDWEDAIMYCHPTFEVEVLKAFNSEITFKVSVLIQTEVIKNINNIIFYYPNSTILNKWLYTGRNMYVVNSQFNEIRRNSKL